MCVCVLGWFFRFFYSFVCCGYHFVVLGWVGFVAFVIFLFVWFWGFARGYLY